MRKKLTALSQAPLWCYDVWKQLRNHPELRPEFSFQMQSRLEAQNTKRLFGDFKKLLCQHDDEAREFFAKYDVRLFHEYGTLNWTAKIVHRGPSQDYFRKFTISVLEKSVDSSD